MVVGLSGTPVGEAVVQAGRHIGHAPDVAVLVEHEIVHRREAGAVHCAGLTTLRQPLPAKGIGKKGAPYAASCRGVTNVWDVSRSWTAAGR